VPSAAKKRTFKDAFFSLSGFSLVLAVILVAYKQKHSKNSSMAVRNIREILNIIFKTFIFHSILKKYGFMLDLKIKKRYNCDRKNNLWNRENG
jgi:hypothetical protein